MNCVLGDAKPNCACCVQADADPDKMRFSGRKTEHTGCVLADAKPIRPKRSAEQLKRAVRRVYETRDPSDPKRSGGPRPEYSKHPKRGERQPERDPGQWRKEIEKACSLLRSLGQPEAELTGPRDRPKHDLIVWTCLPVFLDRREAQVDSVELDWGCGPRRSAQAYIPTETRACEGPARPMQNSLCDQGPI